ncbi:MULTISPECIES: ribosome maturation factor RimP [Gordonia]|uniref:ribosome maturation factor RimP n=1 Tax=Gordonia TaxID=2053 RepID=UPI0003F74F60|nr:MULTISPECIES: ribosome maturation factor RimP [Gordonia]KAF0970696.1 Ribosome maturation factor RimP [Gordonia sp. YY1]
MPISPPQVSELVEKLVAEQGFDLEDVTVNRRDGQDELTIVVDRDGGSDLDVLADLSNRISEVLDAVPELAEGDPYVLEVTSPGVDRPLTLPRHWRRNAGRRVAVDVAAREGSEARSVTGRIGKLTGETVEIVMNHRGRIAVESIPLDAVTTAVVQVDFSQPSVTELELCGLDADEIERRRARDRTQLNN